MYFIELNDASRYAITDLIKETTTELKGVKLNAIEFEVSGASVETIRSAFMSEFNTRTVKLLSEQKALMTVYNGYSVLRAIATNEQAMAETPDAAPTYTVTLAMTDDVSKLIPQLQQRIKELEGEIIKLTVPKDPKDMELSELKTYLIGKSKLNLEEYLAANPVVSEVHNGEGLYSCTLEKQTLLNNAIAMAEIHEALNDNAYKVSWNRVGEACTYDWTKTELISLAIEIEAFVKPLISLQQTMETQIMAATTKEEAMAVVITYGTSESVESAPVV